jgi:hypothetical protein
MNLGAAATLAVALVLMLLAYMLANRAIKVAAVATAGLLTAATILYAVGVRWMIG